MSNILINNNFYISTSNACVIDLTPPTFSGIDSLSVGSFGELNLTWLTATDATNPIRYEIYVQEATATGLFNLTNITQITNNLYASIFQLSNGNYLQYGSTYYVGVRAVDAVGNRESNVISDSAISTGLASGAPLYKTHSVFSINSSNQLKGTFWATVNNLRTVTALGTANYQVYDSAGNIIISLTESGIIADVNGLFTITPVISPLVDLTHYVVKVGIVIDGVERVTYKGLTLGI